MIILLAIALLAAAAPVGLNALRRERRRLLLAAQLRQSLSGLVHALKIGVGFQQALEYAAKEGREPLAAEWRHALAQVQVGRPLGEALEALNGRVPLKDMRWFVAAVQITQTTGGSLATVLEALAETLQEQQTLREKVGALTAQGKASGVLLACLPFFVMGALAVVAPEMAAPLFTTTAGQAMVAGVILSVAVGGVIIKKIVTIKVD